jgi:hypothetical protein
MAYKKSIIGILTVTMLTLPIVAIGEERERYQREDHLERNIEERHRKPKDNGQLGYQKEESEEMSRQFHQKRGSGLLEIGIGLFTLAGGYLGISWLWSKFTSGKKSETENQQSESAPTDVPTDQGSAPESQAAPSETRSDYAEASSDRQN